MVRIFNYYKAYDIATEIMGASFRNIGQIRALAGCDLLTISPALLGELAASDAPWHPACRRPPPRRTRRNGSPATRSSFRTHLNEDAMATEKLAEGIRMFTADALKLDALDRQSKSLKGKAAGWGGGGVVEGQLVLPAVWKGGLGGRARDARWRVYGRATDYGCVYAMLPRGRAARPTGGVRPG